MESTISSTTTAGFCVSGETSPDIANKTEEDFVLELEAKDEYKEFNLKMVHDQRLPPNDFFSKNIILMILKKSQAKNFFKEFDFFSVKEFGNTFYFEYSQTNHLLFDEMFNSLPPNFNSPKKLSTIDKFTSNYKINSFKTSEGERWTMCVCGKSVDEIEPLQNEFKFTINKKNYARRGPPRHVLFFKKELDLFNFYTDSASNVFSRITLRIT